MKRWAILVFMAADNDLDRFAVKDLHEMESVGSTDDFDLLVQVDRYGDGVRGSALRGAITRDPNWQPFDFRFVSTLENIGETNTGDPAVLRDFIEWGVLNHPAERYALVIWNHGSGWKPEFIYEQAEEEAGAQLARAMRNINFADRYRGRLQRIFFRRNAKDAITGFIRKSVAPLVPPPERRFLIGPEALLSSLQKASESPPIFLSRNVQRDEVDRELELLLDRAIGLDETSRHDALDSLELKSALQEAVVKISQVTGKPFKFDVLGFDACLMAGLEVAFQIRDVASFVVGSAEVEPAIGWRYDLVAKTLAAAKGDIAPSDLAKVMVGAYIEGMQDYRIRLVTQSAIDMSQLNGLAAALGGLSQLLSEMISPEYILIAKSEKNATRYYDTDFLDLGHFIALLKAVKSDSRLDEAAQALQRAVISSQFLFESTRQSPTGLTVYFPTKPIFDSGYDPLDLTIQVQAWSEAIKAYHFL